MALRSLSDMVSHFFSSMYPRQMYFIFSPAFVAPAHLSLFDRCALSGELLSDFGTEFRRGCGAEILRLEYLSNLDFGLLAGHGIGTALDPFDRLLQRGALPKPEAGDQLFCLGE